MGGSEFTCGIVWSDPDLLELEVAVAFEDWSGRERAYVGRDELAAFIAALRDVAAGGREAILDAGQDDLSFVQLHMREYNRARHLVMAIRLGRAAETIANHPDCCAELRVAVPVERGQLAGFANALDVVAAQERGVARLSLPGHW